jgi:hypothetical protein
MEAVEPSPLLHPEAVVAVGKEVSGSCVGGQTDPSGGVDGYGLESVTVVDIDGSVGDDDHASIGQLQHLQHVVAAQPILLVEGVVVAAGFNCSTAERKKEEKRKEET